MDYSIIMVEISADGQDVTISVKAAPGANCLTLTEDIENAYGPVLARKMTADTQLKPEAIKVRQ